METSKRVVIRRFNLKKIKISVDRKPWALTKKTLSTEAVVRKFLTPSGKFSPCVEHVLLLHPLQICCTFSLLNFSVFLWTIETRLPILSANGGSHIISLENWNAVDSPAAVNYFKFLQAIQFQVNSSRDLNRLQFQKFELNYLVTIMSLTQLSICEVLRKKLTEIDSESRFTQNQY